MAFGKTSYRASGFALGIATALLVCTFVVVAGSGVFRTARREAPRQAAPRPKPEKLAVYSVAEICACYEQSTVRADRRFKNRVFAVAGRVSLVRTREDGVGFVMFKAPRGTTHGVNCDFPKEEIDTLAGLSRDDNVVIAGRCMGRSWEQLADVWLRDCWIFTGKTDRRPEEGQPGHASPANEAGQSGEETELVEMESGNEALSVPDTP